MEKEVKFSGEELRSFMVDGRLPQQYVSEENFMSLLNYEREQMMKNEFYDVSVIIYCTNMIISIYRSDDAELVSWWSESFDNIKENTQRVIAVRQKMKDVELFSDLKEKVSERMIVDEERLIESTKILFQKIAEDMQMKEEIKRRRKMTALSRHLTAIMVAIVIALPIAIIAFQTDILNDLWARITSGETPKENITYIEFEPRIYSSIEEFEATNNIRLLRPTWMPYGLEIEEIEYLEGRLNVHYRDASLIIEFDSAIPPDTDGAEIYEGNGVMFYIFKDISIILWAYDGAFYRFIFNYEFDFSEYIFMIIENIN